jgi:CDP-diacylglycerol---glycerol-3-phosphate 3-phosphatidyltransferase
MLNRYARAAVGHLVGPLARLLVRLGVSPDLVTTVGALGVCVGALWLYPRGQLAVGTAVVTVFALSDMVDGTMARLSGRSSRWGAFLDSTLDRIADAAIFSGLVLWFAGRGADGLLVALALTCLVVGALVSYAKARAEGLGLTADVGIAERSERLVVVLLTTFLHGIGVPYVLAGGLLLLAVASAVTVVQRMVAVRRQIVAVDRGAS